jgi:hypothetical protein
VPGAEADISVRRGSKMAEQGCRGLGAAFFDALDLIVGYPDATGQFVDREAESDTDVVHSLAEKPEPRGSRSAPDPQPAPESEPSECDSRSSQLPFIALGGRTVVAALRRHPFNQRPRVFLGGRGDIQRPVLTGENLGDGPSPNEHGQAIRIFEKYDVSRQQAAQDGDTPAQAARQRGEGSARPGFRADLVRSGAGDGNEPA